MNKAIAIFKQNRRDLLGSWVQFQMETTNTDDNTKMDLHRDCDDFLNSFIDSLSDDSISSSDHESFLPLKDILSSISYARSKKGFTARQTSTYINSLKDVLLSSLHRELDNPNELYEQSRKVTHLIDGFGMMSVDSFLARREEFIVRQKSEIEEISTPLLEVWKGIVAMPIIGTLDTSRTEAMMESLLHKIAKTSDTIVILDISGVPAVDSMVAQHLIKNVSAIRLMGGECIISGIRPEIAQSIVHLSIDLTGIVTKSTFANALQAALRILNLKVVNARE